MASRLSDIKTVLLNKCASLQNHPVEPQSFIRDKAVLEGEAAHLTRVSFYIYLQLTELKRIRFGSETYMVLPVTPRKVPTYSKPINKKSV